MVALLLFLLLTAMVFGYGFAAEVLWWVAAVRLVVWIVGLVAHGPERRWFYW